MARTRQSRKRAAGSLTALVLALLLIAGCQPGQAESAVAVVEAKASSVDSKETRMWMTVGERRFAITLSDTPAAKAFAAQLPLALEMADLNGNEKHVDLKTALPTQSHRPGTIGAGDLMLYGSRTLVVFYESFESTYSYTRLGRLDDPRGLSQALGTGTIRITFASE